MHTRHTHKIEPCSSCSASPCRASQPAANLVVAPGGAAVVAHELLDLHALLRIRASAQHVVHRGARAAAARADGAGGLVGGGPARALACQLGDTGCGCGCGCRRRGKKSVVERHGTGLSGRANRQEQTIRHGSLTIILTHIPSPTPPSPIASCAPAPPPASQRGGPWGRPVRTHRSGSNNTRQP